jgi:hypothetical protein
MLFLLRNIRRKLLTNNKVMTYLLCAIGEIILVVVGIMIAVSIDDWVKHQSDRVTERTYMQSLMDDLKMDTVNFRLFQNNNIAVFSAIDSLIFNLRRPDWPEHGAQSAYWGRIMTTLTMRIHPVERTFEQMKSSGQLHLIADQSTANAISDYYNSFYNLDTYNEATLLWLDDYLNNMGKVFDGEALLFVLKNRVPPPKSSGLITNDPMAHNELIASAQYVYGVIQLTQELTQKQKIAAQNLMEIIQSNYQFEPN